MPSRTTTELVKLDSENETAGSSMARKFSPTQALSCDTNSGFTLKEPVRIKTRNLLLSSGFEYNRVLFDLRVDPTRWDEFSNDVANASRLNRNDKAAIIATITGFSMLGLAGVGIVLGERVRSARKLQRVLANREEGGLLAEVLQVWNENYFCQFGISVWVEVSEAALRDRAKKTGEIPTHPSQSEEQPPKRSFSKQAKKRIEEDRKYMVVVSPLEQDPDVGVFSRESSVAKPGPSFGLVVESHSEDLIDLRDDWSSHSAYTHDLEDPFADPPDYSTSRLVL